MMNIENIHHGLLIPMEYLKYFMLGLVVMDTWATHSLKC